MEIVFEILGEGGGIRIERLNNDQGENFYYHHNEFDPTDEGLGINKIDEYDCSEEVFNLINNRYPWYMLHIETIHDVYKNYIANKLVEKLNGNTVKPDSIKFRIDRLEKALGIKLKFENTATDLNQTWGYKNLV